MRGFNRITALAGVVLSLAVSAAGQETATKTPSDEARIKAPWRTR